MDSAQTLAALTGSTGSTDSTDFASRLEHAAGAGLVVGVEPGAVSVTRLGAGETFTAWLVGAEGVENVSAGGTAGSSEDAERAARSAAVLNGGGVQEACRPPRVVRVVRHPGEDVSCSLRGEYEALSRVPADLGPRGVALEEGSDNALGAPYMVTTYVPGRVVPAQEWTPRLACALAEQVARLHHLLAGAQTVEEGSAGPRAQAGQGTHPGALREAEELVGRWRSHHPGTVEDPRVVRLLSPWWQALASLDPVTVGAPLHPLVHGDVVVTNVVVDLGGLPRLIDWEWAGPGDAAKDLALIGGEVTGGPWYAHLSREVVADMVSRYVVVRGQLAGEGADTAENPGKDRIRGGAGGYGGERDGAVRHLLARRDAWELLDRMGNLLYCLSHGGTEGHLRWAGELADTLEARLTALLSVPGHRPG